MTEFAWGSATDVGRVRRANQDHHLIEDGMFVVADGMGGHSGGEIASEVTVDALRDLGEISTLDELIGRVQDANSKVVERAAEEPALRGMGTTVSLLTGLVGGGAHRLGVANVGDSRLYRVTGDGLHQHTVDHSLVESFVREGRLSRAEAANHPQRNIVTRALGIDDKVLVDAWELVPVAGDRYVLCSDGLFGEIGEPEIYEVLSTVSNPQEAAEDLVSRACAAGGRDNVTVVIVDIESADPVDDVPDDRVIDTRKALPDRVLDIQTVPDGLSDAGDDSDPNPDDIVLTPVIRVLTWRLVAAVIVVAMVLVALLGSLAVYARSAYYVGIDGQEIVIYQGRPGGVLWFDATLAERSGLLVDALDSSDAELVIDGLEFDDLKDAEAHIEVLREQLSSDTP
ncbi:MAG: serine/threonine-protein phosphatase [Acidimicrobiaceae bacterium]|nr:serine/threonine-protein phosphatase [Acidimicrobiaceae bacterium]